MYDLRCPICKRLRGDDPRAKYCSSRCRWRAYWQRTVRAAEQVEALLPATLPPDTEGVLPTGSERSLVMLQIALLGYAPAGARGYRLGIRHGLSQIQRWFPIAKRGEVPVFRLEPFEWPAVPVMGMYAVVYFDGKCLPIGGPRFTVPVEFTDRRICYSEGDRTYKPRPR